MKILIPDSKAIRKRMVDLDIKNINELAAKSGVSRPTIYEFLNGRTPLTPPFIKLCQILETNPLDLLREEDNP